MPSTPGSTTSWPCPRVASASPRTGSNLFSSRGTYRCCTLFAGSRNSNIFSYCCDTHPSSHDSTIIVTRSSSALNERWEAVIVCCENEEFSGQISRNFLVEAAFLLTENARNSHASSRQKLEYSTQER